MHKLSNFQNATLSKSLVNFRCERIGEHYARATFGTLCAKAGFRNVVSGCVMQIRIRLILLVNCSVLSNINIIYIKNYRSKSTLIFLGKAAHKN